ncbi:MAG: SDR family oxidoreductase [Victivallaceae bacterium]
MDFKTIFNLAGHRALITGSSRGIGRTLALTLASAGAEVIVHGSRNDENLKHTVAEVKAINTQSTGIAADLSSSAAVKKLIATAGKIDILVLNASAQSYQTVEDFTPAELERQYEINIRSSFELIQAVLPLMKKQRWGRILAIGSVNQYKPSPRLAIYSTTKAALNNLIMNCAKQYAASGITFNNLAPGVILTDRNADVLKDAEFSQKILGMIPAGRFGDVSDCAGLALVLCSDAGSYITGTDIPVAGGMQL